MHDRQAKDMSSNESTSRVSRFMVILCVRRHLPISKGPVSAVRISVKRESVASGVDKLLKVKRTKAGLLAMKAISARSFSNTATNEKQRKRRKVKKGIMHRLNILAYKQELEKVATRKERENNTHGEKRTTIIIANKRNTTTNADKRNANTTTNTTRTLSFGNRSHPPEIMRLQKKGALEVSGNWDGNIVYCVFLTYTFFQLSIVPSQYKEREE